MKKSMLMLVFICTFIFADLDMAAYTNYKKTSQYQTAAAQPQGPLFVNMKGSYSKADDMLYWSLTLLKIEALTGDWADIGAIAKANHQDFVYTTLTPILVDSDDKKVYRCQAIKRKTMFGKENKVRFASPVPKNIIFVRVTIEAGLITDNNKNKPKDDEASNYEKEKSIRKTEIEKINASLLARGLLQEVRNDRKKELSSRKVCMNYLISSNDYLEKAQQYIPGIKAKNDANSRKVSMYQSKASAYIEKYKKYNCKRFRTDEKISKSPTPKSRHSSIIMSSCKKKWGTNYNMIKYCVDNQTESYNSISNLPDNEIMSRCRSKWGTNYNMIKYCVDNQTESKRSLGL